MHLTPTAAGVFPIAPTPFAADGSLDWASAERLFAWYDGLGADGTTVLGIMGEYLGRLYEQSKGRPLFIVREVVRAVPFDGGPAPGPSSSHAS